ncbi:LRR_1 domain-containing protein/Pkinase_Tyr domain-containing protein/LRRNT_2 domain-containing protein/LRR_8 domain-containing protein [Cephalotus follicularis]|uniref:LRR_1 domain-containing protein/Pkinase_Tyr domain-containing protein/LRRNT_2 domain-containing protein/LRR_8 domain-containing protein n=1 Tax=Cephalotus follicularis TaxID=3775 RepID=A0A1Q3BBT4_CEPFO|nr:LRR_1 domain-containing protein/Pkinase_Tyr domain-containing protein/LRRNT_2 domain-containing protein/LRR_8 domain-containing protein [Cephalotus follicularis]
MAVILDYAVFLLVSLLLPSHRVRVNSEPVQDKQALLSFLSQTPHENRIQWNASDSACNWVGVGCSPDNSSVYTLRLPGAGLVGPIPPNTIGNLSQLRVLSLRSNRLSGEIPSDFSNLTLLRSLYLQSNEFSSQFPGSVTRMTRLTRLDISSNNFSGTIPFSVNNLTHLTGLFLENNRFSGNLPSINPGNLDAFNVSNNLLNGSVPKSLSKFPASAFAGNLDLCGGPLPPCEPFFPSPAPSPYGSQPPPTSVNKKSNKRLSTAAIVGIAVACAVALFLLLLCFLMCLRRRRRQRPAKHPKPTGAVAARAVGSTEAGTSSSKDDITGGSAEAERNKLVFFEGGVYSFDLEDLLRASAEVLGKGSVGTSYKAVLEEGTTVVVKRLKDVVVSKREFELQMEALGKIKNENVVALRAFYFSKDEKLLVYDFMPAGSLSALLHGSRGSGRTPLDWDNRMRIALSAARGLSYLHVAENVVHGNIKSSNVLLRPDHDAAVSDFGLNPLFGTSTPPHRVAGYRAPEVVETRKVTYKSDVYSFGVLLLELLTGKAPNQASLGEEGIDLPRWVQSVVREEWTAEVFDVELMRYHNIEEEMVQLLQIAMTCVSIVPDQRPAMPDVVRMIEEMNRSETDDGLRQSSDDPSKGSDGHTPPPESRTPPKALTP